MIARSFRLVLVVLALVVRTVSAAPALFEHKDERVGFKMQTPREWKEIPTSSDERWIVGKYLSSKENFAGSKQGTASYAPTMLMSAFVKEDATERTKVEIKTKDGKKEAIIEIDSPYKNYKEFLAARMQGVGFYLTEEKEITSSEIAVTTLEHTIEPRGSDVRARIVTWIYHIPDVDVAVEFICLDSAYDKLQPEVQRCFKSFRTIPRTAGNLAGASTGGRALTFLELDDLTPEERKSRRTAMEREAHTRAKASLPDDWVVKQMGRFLVLNHADERYAKKVVEHAEAVLKYLESTFSFIGTGEYVRAPIIRICKDQDEEAAFRSDTTANFTSLEVVIHKDTAGASGYELYSLGAGILRVWLIDRDRDFYFSQPPWLMFGLRDLIGQLRSKSGKIVVTTDHWDREVMRNAARDGKLHTAREILAMTSEDFESYVNVAEASALAAFLVRGEGLSNKKFKDLFPVYVKHVRDIARGIEAESQGDDDGSGDAESEEAENDQYKERQQTFKRAEKRLLEESMTLTFKHWSDADWKSFEAAYRESVD
ncbi:MAG: hypothetical protein ACKVWV_18525 [Planctomycetota bacterium]